MFALSLANPAEFCYFLEIKMREEFQYSPYKVKSYVATCNIWFVLSFANREFTLTQLYRHLLDFINLNIIPVEDTVYVGLCETRLN